MKSHKSQVTSHKSQVASRKTGDLVTWCSVFCLLFFTGCAASTQQIKEGGEKAAIEKISVVGGGREILIEASGPITYTAFKLSDPARLALDIPGADIEKVKAPMDVNNEFINSIAVASYGEEGMAPVSRVEIGLKEGVVSDVKLAEGSILVALNYEVIPQHEAEAPVVVLPQAAEEKAAEAPPLTEPLQQEIAKKEEPIKVAVEEAAPTPAEAEKLAPEGLNRGKEIKKADKLLKIETRKEKNRTTIKVIGNGPIGDFNAFTMDKPAPSRIVVDVWNVKSSIPGDGLAVSSPYIKKVRVGEHPDKVRLVFDSGQKNVPPYTIERIDNSLVITAGVIDVKKPETAAAVAPVTAPQEPSVETAQKPPAAMPAPEPTKADYAEIKAVDFKQLADKARLIITASKRMEYRLLKLPDETGLALDIKDAIIPDELKRTLDASDLNTSVASISSFQAPTEPAKDVRILVKLKEKADYNISQEGEKIQIDFPLLAVAQAVPKMAEIKSQEIKEAKPAEDAVNKEQASGYTGRKISLDFKDADISNILRLMAEVSNLNIIAGEDVKGKVSLRLIDVPWDQAFEIILKTNGLGKVQEGNVVRIMPLAKIKQEDEEALASKKAKEKLEDLEIKLLSVNYAKASELESQVKGLLSDRGVVTVEARTNTLIIKDIPANIAKALDMAKKLDTPTPQVLIEARIVEANSNFARDLGVQWGAATLTTSRDQFSSAFGSASTSPSPTLTPTSPQTPTSFIGSGGQFSSQPNFAVSLPAAGGVGTLGAMGFSFGKLIGDPFLLDLRISAGEKQGLTKTISRPRITTLDNKEAKISQGDRVPFETTSASGTQTQFIEATLSLTVTPHITPDGSVSMKINAKRDSIGSFRSASGAPSISTKSAETEIIVKSGETAVIGGIVIEDKSDTTSGIPWLKEIPIIGWLFKNKSAAESQTELLIFITPNIVKGEVELSPS